MGKRWAQAYPDSYTYLVRANGRDALVQREETDWKEIRGEGLDPRAWVGPVLIELEMQTGRYNVDIYVQEGTTGETLLDAFESRSLDGPGALRRTLASTKKDGQVLDEAARYVLDEWASLVLRRIENAAPTTR